MKKILFSCLIALATTGCLKSDNSNTTTCNYDACANKASAAEIQAMQTYLAGAGITNAIQHCSGVFYVINNPGTGKTPTACSRVNVSYVGKLENGNVFDQSTGYVLSLAQVIAGWANTIPLLKEGGSITLYIPPSLGYGDRDVRDNNNNIIIPRNSRLIFDVTLNVVL